MNLTLDQAQAVSRSAPALQIASVGEKLRYALNFAALPKDIIYVDGDNGIDTNDGLSWDAPMKTIQAAVTLAPAGGTVLVKPKAIPVGSADPADYAETIIIPNTKPGLALIGYNTGRAQGALPQIKKGAGSTALLTIRAPGCLIAGLGFNGGSATGGGILLDDDGATKLAFGTSIIGCHFKNCAGSSATDGRLGGAIQWASTGGAWQILIKDCRFYKNLADIVLLGAGGGVTVQDVVIEDCVFSNPGTSVDVNLWLGGNGITGLVIRRCTFQELPAITSGSVARYMDLTGCVGVLTDCNFGCTGLTFRNASMGTGARVPATVFISCCYQQVAAGAGATGEIGYTA